MPRPSRRNELMETALTLFTQRGYEGTTVADIADSMAMTKAAFSYHFAAKEDLLLALTEPLLASLEAVIARHPDVPEWPDGVRALLADYGDALIAHGDLVEWIDGDKAVLRHPTLGSRLRSTNRAMRKAISGGGASKHTQVAASAILGMFWRPIRNLQSAAAATERDTLVELAMAAATHLRS